MKYLSKITKSVFIVFILLASIFSYADAKKDKIVKNLKKISSSLNAENVKKGNIMNMYEVQDGADIVYVSDDGKYLIIGNVIDLETQKNLTENLRKTARKKVLDQITEEDMIIYKPKGKIKHKLTVFTDIDCGYCRKLHSDLQGYLDQGIEIRYLPFPRAGKGSDSYKKAVTVWCSKDRNKALTNAKLGKDFKIADKFCKDNPVDKSMELVEQLGISGTPALITEDGTIMPGYVPPSAIKSVLDRVKEQG